jgi:hypothetical protein
MIASVRLSPVSAATWRANVSALSFSRLMLMVDSRRPP